MNWMANWRTRSKLLFGFGVILVFFVVVVFTAYGTIVMAQNSQKKFLEEDYYAGQRLSEIRAFLNHQRVGLLQMLFMKDPAAKSRAIEDIREATRIIQEKLNEAFERVGQDALFGPKLLEVRAAYKEFAEIRDAQVIPLIERKKFSEAEKLVMGMQLARYGKLRDGLLEIFNAIEARAKENVGASNKSAAFSEKIFILTGIAAFLAAILLGFALERGIANPLRAISEAAETIAAGDFTVKMPPHERRDEIGTLSRTFKTMVENLRVVTQQIKEGAGVLAASSSEILAATTQVASSATETATAVSQTTATVEEVKQTAQLSNQKAKHVSESAKKAVEISQSGRKAVEESIGGMTRIREQMESIGESIMKLSEQSQAIGEIIASVGDLAEQSNLLSVNAAIEAAKAGEQGKGFAVVAQEVKALAEQSKQATAQVRTMLGEIQKATSAVVLSAEQGSKAVELGMRQVTQSGESIRALSESVADAALAATQIAASSQQQFVGVDQVASAMESIKQASTQNAAGTKQVETAAQNLARLGSNLKQLVERFRV